MNYRNVPGLKIPFFKVSFLPILFIFTFNFKSQSQSIATISIDHGGLHCPFLGPKFKDRFSKRNEVDSLHVDTRKSIAVLFMNKTLDADTIRRIIIKEVGYPAPEIKSIDFSSRHK